MKCAVRLLGSIFYEKIVQAGIAKRHTAICIQINFTFQSAPVFVKTLIKNCSFQLCFMNTLRRVGLKYSCFLLFQSNSVVVKITQCFPLDNCFTVYVTAFYYLKSNMKKERLMFFFIFCCVAAKQFNSKCYFVLLSTLRETKVNIF